MIDQNDLQAVVQRAKADIAHKYVYVMMPIPQIETLLAGLEEAQRENATMKESLEWIDNLRETMPAGAGIHHFAAAFENVEAAVEDCLSTLTKGVDEG